VSIDDRQATTPYSIKTNGENLISVYKNTGEKRKKDGCGTPW
jgi:hypothetical protein